MKRKMKKWLSCMMAAAMVMSTVNLPTNILASDFGDGVEISVEDENEDAPEVVVDGEEGSDFSDEEVAQKAKETAKALNKEGMPVEKIAQVLGEDEETVKNWLTHE